MKKNRKKSTVKARRRKALQARAQNEARILAAKAQNCPITKLAK